MSERRRIDAFMQFTGAMVPEWLCLRAEVAAGPKLAYARLARFKGRKPYAYPTLEELGDELGVGARQAGRYVAELEKLELIEVEQVGLNQPNRYYFLEHEWMHETATEDGSGVDTSDHPGMDTSDDSGVDASDVPRADGSDQSLYEAGSQSGSQFPPTPPQAGGEERAESILGALSAALGATPTTKAARRQWTRAAADIASAGATDADVQQVVLEFAKRWPEMTCTPGAVARNWPLLLASVPSEAPRPDAARFELRCTNCAETAFDCLCPKPEFRRDRIESEAA